MVVDINVMIYKVPFKIVLFLRLEGELLMFISVGNIPEP